MVKNKDLEAAVALLEEALGTPRDWRGGEEYPPVGALQLVAGSRLYHRLWRLVQVEEGGWARTILSAPTKRELMEQLAAFMAGLQFAGRSSQREG